MLMRRVEVKVVGDGDEEMQIETVGEGKKMSRLPLCSILVSTFGCHCYSVLRTQHLLNHTYRQTHPRKSQKNGDAAPTKARQQGKERVSALGSKSTSAC